MKRRLADRDYGHLHLEILEERRLLAAVTGRHIFYNDSGFDGGPGIDAGDSAAIATDKQGYFTIEQLTDNATFDSKPWIDGSNIVWQGRGGSDAGTDDEIFWYDGTTVTQLTTNTIPDEFPRISAFGIAWERSISGPGHEIIFHDMVTGEESLTTTAVGNSGDEVLTLSDNRLAWEDVGGGDFDILTWNNTGPPTDLSLNTFNDFEPDADGNNVAWVEDSSPTRMRYFNGTSTSTIGTSTFAMLDPEVSGQNVVWEGFLTTGTNNWEIFYYNGTTVQPLTNDSKNDFDPQISGNKIVWWSNLAGVSHIHYFDGSTVSQLSTLSRNQFPQIDGDNVVWQGWDGQDHEIFFFDGVKVTQLTDNDVDDTRPQISGNHVVWQGAQGSAGNTSEIYHAVFNDAALPANVTNYSKGINGIMVDVANPAGTLTLADFTFRMSEQGLAANNTPSSWVSAPAPTGFTVLADTPVAGTDRVEFIWANNAVQNRYLEVIVEGNDTRGGSNTNTGLAASDISYFGNKIGDDFTSYPGFFNTDATDEIDARNNQGIAFSITNAFDFNRDFFVDATDQIIARNNQSFMPAISLGDVPLPPPPAPLAAPDGNDTDGEMGIAVALNATATPSTSPGSHELSSAADAPAMPADSHRAHLARYFEHLDGARGASAEPAAALSDSVELPDDVLDALLKDLLGQ